MNWRFFIRWITLLIKSAPLAWLALCIVAPGCSRMRYVERADRDAYSILDSRSRVDPWSEATELSVIPSPQSRLADPTPIAAPLLPDPAPRLHTYAIPPGIGQGGTGPAGMDQQPANQEEIPAPQPDPQAAVHVSFNRPEVGFGRPGGSGQTENRAEWRVLLTRLRAQDAFSATDDELDISPVTIPRSAWESIPTECRMRMFEFSSVRREYNQSYAALPPSAELDRSPRLSFDDILHLALLNSREYQAQKEQLYRVALRLSLEEYDYQLKFAPFGNRTGVGYEHRGSSSDSFSQLDVPSQVQAEALLGTGTGVVTRLANDVLLTFNGPDGFAADISSELLFGLTHSVFQNDVRFERLTQAERNVVYAARDFARFRRTFYLQLAVQYYNLLRTYRQVEIDSQNFLSLVRVYSQREVEFALGEVARVQIDQVEQNALAARSSLIGTCNNLEDSIDELKIRMGLPTEARINFDLAELESLTSADEGLVKLELVSRVSARLAAELAGGDFDEAAALNQAAQLVARMREAVELLGSPGGDDTSGTDDTERLPSPESRTRLELLQAWLQVAELRVLSDRALSQLQEARGEPEAPAVRVPEVSLTFARSVLALLAEERNLAGALEVTPDQVVGLEQVHSDLAREVESYEALVDEILGGVQLQRLDELRLSADALAEAAVQATRQAKATNEARMRELTLDFDASTQAVLGQLLKESRHLLTRSEDSLPPIDLDMDEASLAALVLRLDLANARGELFDQWRGTKLASDDLKSILDLQARQRLITRNQTSRPFEIDSDESRTELSATIDTPLNRRLQRNAFREQLLNYQLARRGVMALEDAIKQDIRSDLRSIRLSREQHELGIASAALAYERVISTQLQLRLGVPGIVARDYLEAQTAYANALSLVASRHISYILGRITVFTDLEQLQLDPLGRWPALHDPSWSPQIGIEDESRSTYGNLPWGIRYSNELMERSRQFWRVDGDSEAAETPE